MPVAVPKNHTANVTMRDDAHILLLKRVVDDISTRLFRRAFRIALTVLFHSPTLFAPQILVRTFYKTRKMPNVPPLCT